MENDKIPCQIWIQSIYPLPAIFSFSVFFLVVKSDWVIAKRMIYTKSQTGLQTTIFGMIQKSQVIRSRIGHP